MMIPSNLQSQYSFLVFILINIHDISSQTCRNDIRDFFYNVDFAGPFFDRAVYTVLDFSVSNCNHTPIFNFTVRPQTNETRPSFFNITPLNTRAVEPRSDSITVTSDDPDFVVNGSEGSYTLHTNTCPLNYFSPFNRYLFNLTARQTFADGRQPVTSTAIVQINLKNDNVHDPIFTPINQTFFISEIALANTDFGTVYATDADNDVIKYSIKDTRFSIDESTGVLQLREVFFSPAPDYIDVIVTATDDGSSSSSSPPLRRSSDTTIRVVVTAVNRNSPRFLWDICGKSISLSENTTNGTTVKVLTVSDLDLRENGLISISFPPEQLRTTVSGFRNTAYSQFYLEQMNQTNTTRTAILRTKELFDYDEPGAIRVWNLYILATDHGNPQRQTFCNLRINLIDENDNSPEFIMSSWNYTIHIPSVNVTNPQFFRIIAVDADSDQNGEINYYIGTRAVPYFKIESETGIITLHPNINLTSLNSSLFPIIFQVYAQDLGRPARFSKNNATITIYYSNNSAPAQWTDQSFRDLEINILEKFYERYPNQPISQTGDFNGSIFYELTSRLPSLLTISSLFPHSKDFPFRDAPVIQNGNRYTAGILVTRGLHAEIQDHYLLYIRVLVDPPLTRVIRINLIDENDHSPTFDMRSMISSVTAGETGYRTLAQIQAYDRDLNPNNSRIQYNLNRILTDDESEKYFYIELNGTVWTNTTFGREINQTSYRLFITAYNDQPAWNSTRNLSQDFQLDVQVVSANINEPKFDNQLSVENVSIWEKTEIGEVILNLTITDADINTDLNLGILSGNNRNAFTFTLFSTNVDDLSRTQFVAIGQLKVVAPLDYESQKNYTLVLFAFDANNLITINVTIILQAENTKAPLFKFIPGFSSYLYAVAENQSYERLDGPKIRATDSDENSAQPIHYQIYDPRRQLNLENLVLNETDGNATLGIGPYGLLRDPPFGSSEYHFAIRATDENGTGVPSYAEVSIHVNDRNNKAPIPTRFPCIPQGVGSSINITFEDYDDPVASNTFPFQVAVISPANLIQLLPTLSGDGNFILTYNGDLNRTSMKNFTVTFNASDNQSLFQLSSISLIVCDQLNTYPILDGSKNIKVVYVNGYQNALRNADLGSVYVNDLNDWFRANRMYTIRNVSSGQLFNVQQGILSTPDVLRPGFSTILVDVTKPNAGSSALGTIYLEVESIDSEYVRKASTIRIQGEYPETVLGQPLDKLRQTIASLLNINSNSITILSIRSVFQYQNPYSLPKPLESQKAEALTDVIFYVPSLEKSDVERVLNANLAQLQAMAVGPNPCTNYKCRIGTHCRATRTIQPKPSMIDANLTSFVGINILDSADCVNISSSSFDCLLSSLSSAAASKSSSSILGLTFEEGEYAIYDSEKFSHRAPTRFSFDFVVRSLTQNALILLYGRNSTPTNNSFWIAFEIYQSKLRFQFRGGLFLANDSELINSTWYHVECQLIHSTVLLSINDCQYEIPVYDTISTDDFSTMRLYLGGLPRTDPSSNLYPSLPYVDTFSGCIRNVLSNGCYLNTLERLSSAANVESGECPCTVTNSCSDKRLSNIIVPWYTWLIMALVLLLLATILAVTLLTCIRRRQQLKTLTGLYTDDTKENIIDYRGTAGEEDHSTYNLRVLKIPIYALPDGNPIYNDSRSDYIEFRHARRPILGEYIEEKLHEQVIPYANDTQLHYLYEGEGSLASNLSSIESPRSSNENDYEFLQSLDPRFSKLADL